MLCMGLHSPNRSFRGKKGAVAHTQRPETQPHAPQPPRTPINEWEPGGLWGGQQPAPRTSAPPVRPGASSALPAGAGFGAKKAESGCGAGAAMPK